MSEARAVIDLSALRRGTYSVRGGRQGRVPLGARYGLMRAAVDSDCEKALVHDPERSETRGQAARVSYECDVRSKIRGPPIDWAGERWGSGDEAASGVLCAPLEYLTCRDGGGSACPWRLAGRSAGIAPESPGVSLLFPTGANKRRFLWVEIDTFTEL